MDVAPVWRETEYVGKVSLKLTGKYLLYGYWREMTIIYLVGGQGSPARKPYLSKDLEMREQKVLMSWEEFLVPK